MKTIHLLPFKVIVVICLLIFSSCGMQKRLYNKGFYVHVNQPAKKVKPTDGVLALATPDITPLKNTFSSVLPKRKFAYIKKEKKILPDTTVVCDTIYTCKGEKIICKEINVNGNTAYIFDKKANKTHYKLCNETNGNIYTLRNRNVEKIHYASGSIRENISVKKVKTNPFAITGFVCGLAALLSVLILLFYITIPLFILLIFIFSLLAFIFSLIGIIQIDTVKKNHKEHQKGLTLALLGLLFALIAIISFFIVLPALIDYWS